MGQLDLQKMGHNSTGYLHQFAEVSKHAYRCRLDHAADPDVSEVPLKKLFSVSYWRQVVASIDPTRASAFELPVGSPEESPNTTHFVVADAEGNIVSATQTIGQLFGSRIMPAGTGIWLNNSLQYCTFESKGNPMDAHAGRRKLSGDCPVIICDEGVPWATLGTPGGHTIPQTVPQIVMNLIDFDMDIASAIAKPRISFAEPGSLLVDPFLPEQVGKELAVLGHQVQVGEGGLGNAHGLTIERNDAGMPLRFKGAADPRGEGIAAGV
jgi:gamma-glutamyltranspeptidase/glutathione hydrolase